MVQHNGFHHDQKYAHHLGDQLVVLAEQRDVRQALLLC
jgi:hypothetical protein